MKEKLLAAAVSLGVIGFLAERRLWRNKAIKYSNMNNALIHKLDAKVGETMNKNTRAAEHNFKILQKRIDGKKDISKKK